MKRYCMEAVGAFFLVLSTALTSNPMAIGMMYMAMVFIGKHISGAHFNPAISLAMYMRKSLAQSQVLWYMAAQVIGGFVAACVFYGFTNHYFTPDPGTTVIMWKAFVIEVLFTAVLAAVAVVVLTGKTYQQVHGVVLGFSLMTLLSIGGVYNPAVAIGPMFLTTMTTRAPLMNMLLFIVGPLFGAALAAYALDCMEKGSRKKA